MKNSTRAIPVLALAALAMLMTAPLSSNAFALDYHIEYDSATQSINYGYTGGQPTDAFTIELGENHGCVNFATTPPPLIIGVSGDTSVSLKCVADGNGCGFMEIGFCKLNFGCLEYIDFYFKCREGCVIVEVEEGDCLPSVSEWGLLILLLLLLASGAYVIRRKRAMAAR